jgi:hypothetical protein
MANQNIALLGVTDAAIAALREECEIVPDATTKAGYDAVKAMVSKITKLRTSVDKRHKELKAPVLEQGRALDGEKKRVITALTEIEGPWKKVKKDIDDEAKRLEEERKARITSKIDAIRNLPFSLFSATSEAIGDELEKLNEIDLGDFYELSGDAAAAIGETRERLNQMLLSAIDRETMEAKLAEQAEVAPQTESADQQSNEPAPEFVAGLASDHIGGMLGGQAAESAIDRLQAWKERHNVSEEAMRELMTIVTI